MFIHTLFIIFEIFYSSVPTFLKFCQEVRRTATTATINLESTILWAFQVVAVVIFTATGTATTATVFMRIQSRHSHIPLKTALLPRT